MQQQFKALLLMIVMFVVLSTLLNAFMNTWNYLAKIERGRVVTLEQH